MGNRYFWRLAFTTGEVFCKDLSYQKRCVGDGGKLVRALDDGYGTGVTVRSFCEKRFERKVLQKSLKLSDRRKRIRSKFGQFVEKSFDFFFVFDWFRERNEI